MSYYDEADADAEATRWSMRREEAAMCAAEAVALATHFTYDDPDPDLLDPAEDLEAILVDLYHARTALDTAWKAAGRMLARRHDDLAPQATWGAAGGTFTMGGGSKSRKVREADARDALRGLADRFGYGPADTVDLILEVLPLRGLRATALARLGVTPWRLFERGDASPRQVTWKPDPATPNEGANTE